MLFWQGPIVQSFRLERLVKGRMGYLFKVYFNPRLDWLKLIKFLRLNYNSLTSFQLIQADFYYWSQILLVWLSMSILYIQAFSNLYYFFSLLLFWSNRAVKSLPWDDEFCWLVLSESFWLRKNPLNTGWNFFSVD